MSESIQGKTVTAIKIASDKKAVKFLTEDGEVVARTDGDCCSDSWIESVEMPALGFPALVLSVDDLDMPEPAQPEYDVIEAYGCKIKTDKGDIVIDYRNSSNGYYGGNLVWPGEDSYFYGGVYGQNVSSEEWVDIR